MQLQEIFNAVITAGLYNEQNCLMCHSLREAALSGVVTTLERDRALFEINAYLSGFGSLGGFLDYKKSDFDFQTRLSVYQDWANRPFQKEVK